MNMKSVIFHIITDETFGIKVKDNIKFNILLPKARKPIINTNNNIISIIINIDFILLFLWYNLSR